MKISVIDGWRKFMPPVIDHWRAQGHEVTTSINWGPQYVEGADVVYFYAIENNLRVASHKDKKKPGVKIIAEAVDIDIYSGAFGGINWEYLDALIFMAHHKRELGLRKAGGKLPSDLPIYIVPGGINLDTWTYRRDPRRGYNVAWIGRLWVAKGIFSALQVFHQLIKTDPVSPWHLYLRADGKLNPEWWKDHVNAYLEANDDLRSRITWVPFQDDLNEWLEDMDYCLTTSHKEAYSYSSAQCASKGIPVIMQMTAGMDQVWPSSWIFQTHAEAVGMFFKSYEPETYRAYIADMYPLSRRCTILDEICGL